jgi:hypothetical protein
MSLHFVGVAVHEGGDGVVIDGGEDAEGMGEAVKKGGQYDLDFIAPRMDVQTRCNCPRLGHSCPPPKPS